MSLREKALENITGKGENTCTVCFPRTHDSHCDRIHSSLTVVRNFDDGCVKKQLVEMVL